LGDPLQSRLAGFRECEQSAAIDWSDLEIARIAPTQYGRWSSGAYRRPRAPVFRQSISALINRKPLWSNRQTAFAAALREFGQPPCRTSGAASRAEQL